MPEIPTLDPAESIVNEAGEMTEVFQKWALQITNLDLIVGTGSPEGNITAQVGREYLDDAGTAGAVKFIKQKAELLGDRAKGWVAV